MVLSQANACPLYIVVYVCTHQMSKKSNVTLGQNQTWPSVLSQMCSITQMLILMMQLCTKYTTDNVIFIPYFNNKIHQNIISHQISLEETSFGNGHDLKSAQPAITPWE